MEKADDNQWELPIAELRTYKRSRRKVSGSMETEAKGTEETKIKRKKEEEKDEVIEGAIVVVEEDRNETASYVDQSDNGVKVSVFDYSVDNFFQYLDTISKLCGEPAVIDIEQSELLRLSSSVTFLREWSSYQYEPRNINFTREIGSSELKDVARGVNLPHLSSAAVPKEEDQYGHVEASKCSKDFVMYVGGLVWAMDWCPRMQKQSDNLVKQEFIAISVHPPRGSYHKLGAPLSGRGVIQVWCVLNNSQKNEDISQALDNKPITKQPRGRPRKKPIGGTEDDNNQHVQDRSRRRSKKKTIEEPVNENINDQCLQMWAIRDSATLVTVNEASGKSKGYGKPQDSKKGQKCYRKASSAPKPVMHVSVNKKSNPSEREESCSNNMEPLFLTENEKETHHQAQGKGSNNSERKSIGDDMSCSLMTEFENYLKHHGRGNGSATTGREAVYDTTAVPLLIEHDNGPYSHTKNSEKDPLASTCSVAEDVPLPQLVLCLAHNGEVAWDVKWRPVNGAEYMSNHLMGYLAVLLGNGCVEVWEVPLPCALKAIYSYMEGTDPRFIKLDPVFKSSILKCGGIQSIPLTVEWSVSNPHDYLLAGCHDGTVALWKFSLNSSTRDARPLLCFSADTVPIRSLAWAPIESNTDSANIILTASHGGLKFWDIRDPFQPLWDLHPSQRIIYGLDWTNNPSCIIMSFDDGTMRTLSLLNGPIDLPVNGRNHRESKLGLHTYNCSSFAVWSVQVSRLTGMVAYCGADGDVVCFQLTTKAVGSDYARNRPPQYLCGSFSVEESTLTVNTPVQKSPRPSNKHQDGPQSLRSASNQGKRADDLTEKTSELDEPILALCNGDDPSIESEPLQTFAKSKRMSKGSSGIKRKPGIEQTLVCKDNPTNREINIKEKLDTSTKFEAFPHRSVAVNVVRWNMNRGSEKWLCYGGASGLVRCQEINLFGVDNTLATKR